MTHTPLDYATAGVDTAAGDRAVELMKAAVARTHDATVVGATGGFAGMVDASALLGMKRPLLATSTDGVGTKIAIARAILKDAPILVLDEATANIDPDCEEHLQAAISALAKGKTLIVIAHRIRTIIHLNSILVISGGKVIAQETHSALLKDCPTYQSLFSAYKESENWALMTNRGVQC